MFRAFLLAIRAVRANRWRRVLWVTRVRFMLPSRFCCGFLFGCWFFIGFALDGLPWFAFTFTVRLFNVCAAWSLVLGSIVCVIGNRSAVFFVLTLGDLGIPLFFTLPIMVPRFGAGVSLGLSSLSQSYESFSFYSVASRFPVFDARLVSARSGDLSTLSVLWWSLCSYSSPLHLLLFELWLWVGQGSSHGSCSVLSGCSWWLTCELRRAQ